MTMLSFDGWHRAYNNGETFSQKWDGKELSVATHALGDDLSAYITYAVSAAVNSSRDSGLRDHLAEVFAKEALSEVSATPFDTRKRVIDIIAGHAYAFADAMLAAREGKK